MQVDADDDTITRYVVHRYAYDPSRRERRHVVVAAYDNAGEFEARLEACGRELKARRAAGEPVDPSEHYTGAVYEPGYRVKQGNARLVKRAIRHGVFPERLRQLELPSSIAVASARLRPRPSWPAMRRVRSVVNRLRRRFSR